MDLLGIATLILGAGGGLILTLEILLDHPLSGRVKRKKGGKWQAHPCVLPERKSMRTSENQIWVCKCGRRWKYLRRQNYTRVWEERTAEMDLADAEMELKKTLKEK